MEDNCYTLNEKINAEIRILLEGKEFPLTTEGDRELALEKKRALEALRVILPVLIREKNIEAKIDREFLGECMEVLLHTFYEEDQHDPGGPLQAIVREIDRRHDHLRERWRKN